MDVGVTELVKDIILGIIHSLEPRYCNYSQPVMFLHCFPFSALYRGNSRCKMLT